MKLMERKANRSQLVVEAGTAGMVLFAGIPILLEISKSILCPFRQGAVELWKIGSKYFWNQTRKSDLRVTIAARNEPQETNAGETERPVSQTSVSNSHTR
jgi:hypothetical protein